ncbi:MAG: insulinase family protein [Rikenellaceae bacterium]
MNKKIKMLLMSVAAVIFTATSLMAQIDPMAPIEIDKDVRIGKVPSGLTYYIRHNAKPKGQADFYILTNVGAIQEEDDQQGLAHFLEHMAFNGTKNLSGKDLIEYLEKIGVKFGANLNAYTSWDQTTYLMQDVPVSREGVIDSALLILHDWSSFIDPHAEEIDAERGVIKEELRTRDNAQWRSVIEMIKTIGHGTRYAERNLIGYLEDLETFEHDALIRFYESWYRPDNQAIVIVGDIDVDQVEAKIQTLMADLPMPAVDAPQKEVINVLTNEEPIISVYTDPEMTTSSLMLLIKGEAMPNEYNNSMIYEIQHIANTYISIMQSERLREIAMQPNAPFTSASMGVGSIGIIPTLESVIYSVTTQDGKLNEGFEALAVEMEKTRRYGFNVGEFERAQANLMQSIEQQYNNSGDKYNNDYVQGYLDHFAKNTPIPDAETEFKMDSMIINMLSVNQLNMMVQQLISPLNQTIIINAPEREGLVNPTEEDILATITKVAAMEVEAYEDNVVKVPLIDPSIELKGSTVISEETNDQFGTTEWNLANGIQVIVRPSTLKADEVQLTAKAYGGNALLADEDYNTASFLSMILSNSGVSEFSATELQKQLSGKNASASIWTDQYTNGLSGSSSVKDIETMLQLVYLNFTAPRYNEDDFNTLIAKYYDYAKNIKSDPDNIFQDFLLESIYDNNIRKQALSTEMLDDIQFERLPAVFDTLFSDADSFRFVITGNVNLETLKPLVEKYIGSLPTTESSISLVDDSVRAVKGAVNKQTVVSMTQPKVSVLYYLHNDYEYSLKNSYIAQFLTSALNNRYLTSIREEKGGTYGVGVSVGVSPLPIENITMHIQFDTNEQQVDELCEIIIAELEDMATSGPSEEQMGKSREFMLKNFENNLESNGVWATYIQTFYTYGYNTPADGRAIIESITAEDVKSMMQSLLDGGNIINVKMLPEAKYTR